jgi:L-serine deaminase
MKVFKPIVQIGQAHPNNASITLREGEAIHLGGEPLVRTCGGHLEPVAGWTVKASEAYLSGAVEIERACESLSERAAYYRTKALEVRRSESPA